MPRDYIFSTIVYRDFTKQLAKQTKLKIGQVEIKKFSDGEIYLRVAEKVRGKRVYVIGTTAPPADNLLELLFLISALKTARVKQITAIIPYFGYGRADHEVTPHETISAKLMAELLKCAGLDRLITFDLHSARVEKFFKVPITHIKTQELLIKKIKKSDDLVVVATDAGALYSAKHLAHILGAPIAYFDKIRPRHNIACISALHGEVDKKHALLVDDMIDTAGTIAEAAKQLKNYGAKTITVAVTHGLFSGSAIKRLQKAPIDKIIVTDTIPNIHEKKLVKLKIISIVSLLAKYIL